MYFILKLPIKQEFDHFLMVQPFRYSLLYAGAMVNHFIST